MVMWSKRPTEKEKNCVGRETLFSHRWEISILVISTNGFIIKRNYYFEVGREVSVMPMERPFFYLENTVTDKRSVSAQFEWT